MVRSFARRQGDLVFFSFVADLATSPSAGSDLFELDGSIALPESGVVDFILLDGSRVAHFGRIDSVQYIPAQGDPYIVGRISCISTLPAGTVRGEAVWSIV